jgi:hypothetical protein
VGSDQGLWHTWWSGAWSGWESLGGIASSDPGAVSWGPDRLDVFVRGADNALWQNSWATGWTGWKTLGGALTSGPDAASLGPNRISLFTLGANGSLFELTYDGGWGSWVPFGGQWASSPAATSRRGGLEVFERGTDGALWHSGLSGSPPARPRAR